MPYPQANRFRERIDLSGFWQFDVDPEGRGEEKGWSAGLRGGRTIAVPASFNEQFQAEDFPQVDVKNYMGAVWYETRFWVPSGWTGMRIWLRVGAAFYQSRVWINGDPVGSHIGGFFPFDFEVTEYVHFAEENSLVVSVDTKLSAGTLPVGGVAGAQKHTYPAVNFDYFPYGGIHRPVLLYATPQNYIEDLRVDTKISARGDTIDLSVAVVGEGLGVRAFLQGSPHEREEFVAGEGMSGRLEVKEAVRWSPRSPHLYRLVIELMKNGEPIDRYTQSVGIRTVRVDGDRLLLNEEPIFLRGLGKHEDFPVVGKGLLPAQIIKDFSLLRWIGANSFRCVHYPYSEEMMNMADKEGMLVVGEVPAVGLTWKLLTPQMKELHKEFIRKTISKDRNHPSVIIWCLANEPRDIDNPEGLYEKPPTHAEEYFRDICNYARQLDSRPVTIADCTLKGEEMVQHCDVVALNRYYGWYEKTARLQEGLEELGKSLDRYHDFVKKPVLLTEFGADAIAGVHFDPPEMWTEEYQADVIRETIRVAESKPYVVGTLIWAFADFKTCQELRRVVYNHKGVFTRDRQPKLAAHVVRELWKKRDAPGRG